MKERVFMPCLATHYYFGKDVFERLGKETKSHLEQAIPYFESFNQGPDFFFAYHLLNLKKGQQVRDFGRYMQTHKTKDFFFHTIQYILDHDLQTDPQVIAFLYGFICHYTLDLTVHPFVFYKTGAFHPKEKDTHKYNGKHMEMETCIDAYLIFQREKMFPKEFKIHNCVLEHPQFNDTLLQLIDSVCHDVYQQEKMGSLYEASLHQTYTFYRLMRYDPTGIKKAFYSFVDFMTPSSVTKVRYLSYNIKEKRKRFFMNLEKEQWNHPFDPNEAYHFSFIELYRIAITRAVDTIEAVEQVLYRQKKIDTLNDVFQNLSYTTGKDCDIHKRMRYFEY